MILLIIFESVLVLEGCCGNTCSGITGTKTDLWINGEIFFPFKASYYSFLGIRDLIKNSLNV